jgi:hypothetical protein
VFCLFVCSFSTGGRTQALTHAIQALLLSHIPPLALSVADFYLNFTVSVERNLYDFDQLNMVGLAVWPSMQSVQENAPSALVKNTYSAILGGVFYTHWLIVLGVGR